ncbi:hypothetical protein L596_017903 [Steinernema carpocapsae]|uniref:Uncharacterized protein n=1 Tax=Steinernema carpocapsae TaxID=34508 RepID=A0A4U5N3S2_STECR|nr:hypothetical protein L596_017903 [Steinernema carpocapsae]
MLPGAFPYAFALQAGLEDGEIAEDEEQQRFGGGDTEFVAPGSNETDSGVRKRAQAPQDPQVKTPVKETPLKPQTPVFGFNIEDMLAQICDNKQPEVRKPPQVAKVQTPPTRNFKKSSPKSLRGRIEKKERPSLLNRPKPQTSPIARSTPPISPTEPMDECAIFARNFVNAFFANLNRHAEAYNNARNQEKKPAQVQHSAQRYPH